MWNFLSKDLRVLIRNRTELILLLLMPFILICILGFALRGLLEGDTEALSMQVAYVQEDEEAKGIEQFKNDLNDAGLPPEAVVEMETAATTMLPSELLEGVFEDDEVKNMIEIVEMNREEAEDALQSEEVEAVLTLPEEFTYRTLQKMFLDQGEGSRLQVAIQEEGRLQGELFQTIIESFAQSINFEAAIAKVTDGEVVSTETPEELGEIKPISTRDPISSFQYYTIAMSVMFVLYVASTISSQAYLEKSQHVFDRIILSGKSTFAYLSGKFISATVIAFIQLFILFGLSTLIFQSFASGSLSFWLGMLAISSFIALCVGGLATLLTSISVRFNNDKINGTFSGGIVSLLAFAGGSFVPVTQLPDFVGAVGGFTPNGAALNAYIKWMQGTTFVEILPQLGVIVAMSVLLFCISLTIIPRRSAR